MPRLLLSMAAVTHLALAAGCSSQQLYAAGQAWQRNECQKFADAQERQRCLSSASTPYQDYKRQADAAKNPNY